MPVRYDSRRSLDTGVTEPRLFATDLQRYGPEAILHAVPPDRAAAEAYCRQLATSHYENFPIVSWLLPKELHQHFYNVYAYCTI